MQLMSLCCGLLIVWTLIDRLDDVYRDIVGIVYFLDVLVVVVHKANVGLLIIARGLRWVFWGLGGGVGVRGGGGVEVFSNWIFFPQKHLPGVLKRKKKTLRGDFGVFGAPHAPTRRSRGVGKRYTSSYHHDMWPVKILERSGLAVKNYHPETLAAEE